MQSLLGPGQVWLPQRAAHQTLFTAKRGSDELGGSRDPVAELP